MTPHAPRTISPRTAAVVTAALCGVLLFLLVLDTVGYFTATREEVEGPITKCTEYSRGVQHSISVYLETLDADAHYGINGPRDAITDARYLCDMRAEVKIVAYDTTGLFGRWHRIAAIRKKGGNAGFDEDKYASEMAPSLMGRGLGAFVLLALAITGIWLARRRTPRS